MSDDLNLIDWMRATSYWMQQDRPDLYPTAVDALNDLEDWMEKVRESAGTVSGVETGGFLLTHSDEDGAEEWQLSKVISSCVIFQPENEVGAFSWTHGSGTMKIGVALPDVSDALD